MAKRRKHLHFELSYKRLERGQFARLLGVADSPRRGLSRTEFLALLEGVDLVVKRQRKRYKKVA